MKTHEAAKVIMDMLDELKFSKTCLGCEFFDEKTEGCAYANGARPPARVIVSGCPEYIDRIPF